MSDTPRIVIPQAALHSSTDITLAEYRNACWFANMWEEHCQPGMHLRAIHYRLVSVGGVLMAPGVREHPGRKGRPPYDPVRDAVRLPYENTTFCWKWLQECANQARYWRLVDARHFEEHRSPRASVNASAREAPTPGITLPEAWPIFSFPQPEVVGYDYQPADQPLMVELWCEKSTMDDILAPLCLELHVNYQPLSGMFSVTRAVEMLCRAQKPTVVLYVSDLDAAGCNMPTAFKEALDHYGPIYAPGLDIRLKQIALTEQQVLDYGLPRNVIDKEKESDYNKRFRIEHPLGSCELDALEAIRPGELAQLVSEAVAPYVDQTLHRRLARVETEAQILVAATWDEQTAEAREALDNIENGLHAIQVRLAAEVAPHQVVIDRIRLRFDEEMRPLKARRDEVRQSILAQPIEVKLPARPVARENDE